MTEAEIKAGKAKELLANELFNEAFDFVRDAYIQGIESAPVTDIETRNQLGISLSSLASIKTAICAHINDAIMEQ